MYILTILVFATAYLVADTFYKKGYTNGWNDCYGGLIKNNKTNVSYSTYLGNPEDLEGD